MFCRWSYDVHFLQNKNNFMTTLRSEKCLLLFSKIHVYKKPIKCNLKPRQNIELLAWCEYTTM